MMEQKKKQNKRVNTMTDIMRMRFAPKVIPVPAQATEPELLDKFKSMIPWTSKNEESPDQVKENDEDGENQNTLDSVKRENQRNQLKYLQKLTMEHILIGNQNQLDLINISNVYNKFVDTQYLWSMRISAPIDLLAIDFKKFIIALGNQKLGFIEIYRYNNKKICKKPIKIYTLNIPKFQPKSICFFKDTLAVITSKVVLIYVIDNNDQVILKSQNIYQLPQNCHLQFYTAPQPFQTTLNIFLEQCIPKKSVFSLWLVQVQYIGKHIKAIPAQKIYDIKKSLRKKIILKNFSKQTFLMNLGAEILVFKKGYMIDSANINLKNEHSILKYNGDERLIHLSDRKFEIYEFILNTKRKPYKIKLSPLDAIDIQKPKESQYFNLIQVFNGCFMIVFQIIPEYNKKTKGQIDYWFALTQPISLSAKINMIFSSKKLTQFTSDELLDKCDTAQKMGLNTKQIYLQLWNRSGKSSEYDFSLLINTRDYETIQNQIVKKLKKASMNFLKIQKNERDSLAMLSLDYLNTKCSTKILNNYICSHFWLKKLQNWRDLTMFERHITEQPPSKLMIGVHDYYELKNTHLYNTLLALINDLCIQGKDVAHKIRFMVYHFKFPLRMIYKELLEETIRTLGCKTITLLQKIPQMLPYVPENAQPPMYTPFGYYEGIWTQISDNEWKQNLSLDKIKTIDNEVLCKNLIKDLNFRRNQYENHGLIMESNEKIIENFKLIKSDKTFYSVIEWIFESICSKQELQRIFSYIENTYPLMPAHLKGRVILYNDIYHFLQKNKILPQKQGRSFTFHEFLQFEDHYLFRHLFLKQKTEKGLILKKIKPIYEQVSSEGLHYFNENLLNYFKNPVSSLSDLKYIFNRINNEKKEFHLKNQEMYEVLVRTMGYKLMVGTDEDIPLSEILIYVENIPIEKGNQILKRLELINDIHKNVQLLSQSKINMSVQQIINDPHTTMSKVLDHLIVKEKVRGQMNEEAFMRKAYSILATTEYLYDGIYRQRQQSSFFIFFLYLAKISVDLPAIKLVKMLLKDQNLKNEFKFDDGIGQSLVLYIYKLKLFEDPVYVNNERYLRSLMALLPQQNEIRQFIICEFQFAKLLTYKPFLVQYPLSEVHPSPNLIQLQYLLSKLPIDYVLTLPVQHIYSLMDKMITLNSRICQGLQFLVYEDKSELVESVFFNHQEKNITKREVYEEFIIRILSAHKIRESIPYIQKYLNEQASNKEYDVVHILSFLMQLENDINQQDKVLIRKIAAFYFRKPIPFFQIIKNYITRPLNRRQRTQYLKQAVIKGQSISKGFNIQNKLLSQSLIKIAQRQGLQNKLFTVLQNCYKHLSNQKSDFHKMSFHFIFTMITNSPYVVCKYMITSKKIATLKSLRIFLTYLTKADIFSKNAILEYGRRIFLIILYSLKDQTSIQETVQMFLQYPLDMDLPSTFTPTFDEDIPFFTKLWQSSEAFRKQKEKHRQIQKRIQKKRTTTEVYHKQLMNPSILANQDPYQYEELLPDDEAGGDEEYRQKKHHKKKNIKELQASEVVKKLSYAKSKKDGRNPQPEVKIKIIPDEGILKTESKEMDLSQFEEQFKIVVNKPQQGIPYSQQQAKMNPQQLVIVNEIIRKSSLSIQKSEEQEQKQHQQQLREFERQERQREEKNLLKNKKKISDQYSSIHKQVSNKKRLSDQSSEDNIVAPFENLNQIMKDAPAQSLFFKDKYPYFDQFPQIPQLGLKLYRTNLIQLQKKNKKNFNLQDLRVYEDKPDFSPNYLRQIIRYLYYDATQSPLVNILQMIEYLVSTYPTVNIQKKNFHTFVRLTNLYCKYNLQLPIRSLFPIQATFDISSEKQQLFKSVFPFIMGYLDVVNVYKVAKVVSLAFESPYIQNQIIFAFFLTLLSSSTQSMERSQIQLFTEKAQVLIHTLCNEILCQRYIQGYERLVDQNLRKRITKMVIEKIKRKGSRQEKLKFFSSLEAYEPQCREMLSVLTRGR